MSLFYFRFQGLLPGGERWATGFHTSGAGTIDDALSSAGFALNALWSGNGGTIPGIRTHMAAEISVTSLVVYQLNPSNMHATAKRETGVSMSGSGATAALPQEVSEVATLRTSGVGPAYRGRMYLPPVLATSVLLNGRLDSLVQADLATSVAGALGEALGTDFTPVLASAGRADRPITSVDVGDVFDAQRRRRDKLLETRTSSPVVPV